MCFCARVSFADFGRHICTHAQASEHTWAPHFFTCGKSCGCIFVRVKAANLCLFHDPSQCQTDKEKWNLHGVTLNHNETKIFIGQWEVEGACDLTECMLSFMSVCPFTWQCIDWTATSCLTFLHSLCFEWWSNWSFKCSASQTKRFHCLALLMQSGRIFFGNCWCHPTAQLSICSCFPCNGWPFPSSLRPGAVAGPKPLRHLKRTGQWVVIVLFPAQGQLICLNQLVVNVSVVLCIKNLLILLRLPMTACSCCKWMFWLCSWWHAVVSTGIADQDLKELCHRCWKRAFEKAESSNTSFNHNTRDEVNCKATVAIEHIIEASNIGCAMQHWCVHCKSDWNLFEDFCTAHLKSWMDKDPTEFWCKGERKCCAFLFLHSVCALFVLFFLWISIWLHSGILWILQLKQCSILGVSSVKCLVSAAASVAQQPFVAKGCCRTIECMWILIQLAFVLFWNHTQANCAKWEARAKWLCQKWLWKWDKNVTWNVQARWTTIFQNKRQKQCGELCCSGLWHCLRLRIIVVHERQPCICHKALLVLFLSNLQLFKPLVSLSPPDLRFPMNQLGSETFADQGLCCHKCQSTLLHLVSIIVAACVNPHHLNSGHLSKHINTCDCTPKSLPCRWISTFLPKHLWVHKSHTIATCGIEATVVDFVRINFIVTASLDLHKAATTCSWNTESQTSVKRRHCVLTWESTVDNKETTRHVSSSLFLGRHRTCANVNNASLLTVEECRSNNFLVLLPLVKNGKIPPVAKSLHC